MTREELLQHDIYCPKEIDKSILAYLNMDFRVLVRVRIGDRIYVPVLISDCDPSPYLRSKYHITYFDPIMMKDLTVTNSFLFYNNKVVGIISSKLISWRQWQYILKS